MIDVKEVLDERTGQTSLEVPLRGRLPRPRTRPLWRRRRRRALLWERCVLSRESGDARFEGLASCPPHEDGLRMRGQLFATGPGYPAG